MSETSPEIDLALCALRDRLASIGPAGSEDSAREDELRAAFRRSRAAAVPLQAPPSSARPRRRVAAGLAAAAGALAVLGLFMNTAEQEGPAAGADAAQDRPAGVAARQDRLSAGEFQPLLAGPGFSPSASYSIVRVRLPLSALAPGTPAGATLEADVLVGEDGLASGIRFDPADAVLVYTVSH